MPSDSDPVSYGRWQAEHDRLRDQIRDMEARLDAEIRDMGTRLDAEIRDLREDLGEFTRKTAARRNRQWALGLAFLTGLALPLAVTAIIVLAGLH